MENKIDDNLQSKCAIKLKTAEAFSLLSNYFDNAFGQKIKGSDVRRGAVYAAIGSGMLLLTIIPIIGILCAVIGVILEFLGIKKLSDNAKSEKNIFKNFIFSYILILIAAILLTIGSISSISIFFNLFNSSFNATGFILVGFIALIFGVILMDKYLTSIGLEYNVPLMKYIAIEYRVGMILTPLYGIDIMLTPLSGIGMILMTLSGIGFIILLIAHIAKIVTYLNIEK